MTSETQDELLKKIKVLEHDKAVAQTLRGREILAGQILKEKLKLKPMLRRLDDLKERGRVASDRDEQNRRWDSD